MICTVYVPLAGLVVTHIPDPDLPPDRPDIPDPVLPPDRPDVPDPPAPEKPGRPGPIPPLTPPRPGPVPGVGAEAALVPEGDEVFADLCAAAGGVNR